MIINASVYDIRSYAPATSDQFFFDANSIIWLTYSNASVGAHPYQVDCYPEFYSKVLKANKNGVFLASSTFAEVMHVIERMERDIAQGKYSLAKKPSSKDFRSNYGTDWQSCLRELQNASNFMKKMKTNDTKIDDDLNNFVISQMAISPVDSYDCYLVGTMKRSKVLKVVSDDCDIATFDGINMYTANAHVISAAKAQGKFCTV